MPLDLDRDDTVGIWTPHPELAKGTWKDGDEWYRIRALFPDIMNHFDKQSLRPQKNPQTRQVEMKRDEDIYNELLWDHAIEDWRVLDKDGQPVPCTLENKMKFAGKYAKRVNWIVDTGIDYGNDDAIRRQAEEAAFRCVGKAQVGSPVAEMRGMPEPA